MAGKTEKKLRSKWTHVAVEGATTDGRKIERSWIEEMAASYDRNTYGARINCEHIRGLGPDALFGSFGDVTALKAEEAEIAGVKKLALFAQIEPTESLVALNKKGQKVYTSIEIDPKFADSGKAYLVGIAVTDSPASLGTEALKFNAHRKLAQDNLFTSAEETPLDFEEIDDAPGMFTALKSKVGELLGKAKEKEGKDAASFSALGELIEDLAAHGAEQATAFAAEKAARESLQAQHDTLSAHFADILKKLQSTPADEPNKPQFSQRPPVTGGDGRVVTDC